MAERSWGGMSGRGREWESICTGARRRCWRRRREGRRRRERVEGREIEGEMLAGEIDKLSGTPKAALASV